MSRLCNNEEDFGVRELAPAFGNGSKLPHGKASFENRARFPTGSGIMA